MKRVYWEVRIRRADRPRRHDGTGPPNRWHEAGHDHPAGDHHGQRHRQRRRGRPASGRRCRPAGLTRTVRIAVADVFRPPLLGIREARPLLVKGSVCPSAWRYGWRCGAAHRPSGRCWECRLDDTLVCTDGSWRLPRTGPACSGSDLPASVSGTPRILVILRDTSRISDTIGDIAGVSIDTSSTRTGTVAGSGLAVRSTGDRHGGRRP